jgi:hypothetical protein
VDTLAGVQDNGFQTTPLKKVIYVTDQKRGKEGFMGCKSGHGGLVTFCRSPALLPKSMQLEWN